MMRTARGLSVVSLALGFGLIASACAPAAPTLSDAELMKRLQQHRAEFEKLRDLGLPLATAKAALWAEGKVHPGQRVTRGLDSLDQAWLADPRVVRARATLGLAAIHVSPDSGMYYAIPWPQPGRDSLPAGTRVRDQKGIGWAPHPSWGPWNEVADLDTLHANRAPATFYRLLDGGWFLFRVMPAARTP